MCNSDVPRIGPRMILVQRHWVAGWKLWLVWFTASYAFPTLCNADVPRIGPIRCVGGPPKVRIC